MNTQTIQTAEPFFLPGSRTGILLIHGFTGAPREMRLMGEYLNRELGFTCLGIRLTGHATTLEDMVRSRWTDWTVSVEDGYNLLCDATDSVYLVGLSMGGALSLLMSTRFAGRVKGVVAMSTPYKLSVDHPVWLLRLIGNFKAYIRKTNEVPGSSWVDKKAYAEHVSYPFNPIRSAAELKILLENMRAALSGVNMPVCLMHSRDDGYVLPENMEKIYAGLVNVADKTKFYLTGSGHALTIDAARGQVFEIARDFIRRVESARG